MENTREEDKQLLAVVNELQKYQATGLTPEQIIEMDKLYHEKCKELSECQKNNKVPYEGLGMLIVAPLKPEDHVYTVFYDYIEGKNRTFENRVTEIRYISWYPTGRKWQIKLNNNITYEEKDIGERIFLSREEAENAIKKMEEKQ